MMRRFSNGRSLSTSGPGRRRCPISLRPRRRREAPTTPASPTPTRRPNRLERSETVRHPDGNEVDVFGRPGVADEVAREEVGVGRAQRGVPVDLPVDTDARLVPDERRPAAARAAEDVTAVVVEPIAGAVAPEDVPVGCELDVLGQVQVEAGVQIDEVSGTDDGG